MIPKHKGRAAAAAPITIPLWRQDAHGQVIPVRDAEFWRKARNKNGKPVAVACDLCYRKCVIESGEDGWCRYRGNRGGTMTIPDHGILARCQRQMLGYRGGIRLFYPGARALALGLTRCTAACVFCSSSAIVHRPDALAWLGGQEGRIGSDLGWNYVKALAHPHSVVETAQTWGAQAIVFAENEPLLSFEYTYDTARLAQAAGLKVVVYTNGFATPRAIARLAPFVDCVDLGIKGSLDPAFYATWMQAPDAVPAVKAAALAWRAAGVFLIVSDLIPAARMQAAPEAAQAALYAWIAAELGATTPLLIGPMVKPDLIRGARARDADESPFIQGRGDTEAAYSWRIAEALLRAHAAGLPYAHTLAYGATSALRCHVCDEELLRITPPPACDAAACVMFRSYCACWQTRLAVERVDDRGGRCAHCGAAVPIVVA